MHLIIMRHGEAGWHSLDHERELTDQGRLASGRIARDLAGSRWRPNRIWASPLVRAHQTAALMAEPLNLCVEEKPFLTPDDDPGLCLDALLAEEHLEGLLIVSHMPLVGKLSTLMVDGHRHGIPFMTSQAVVIELPVVGPGCGDLKDQFLP